MTSMQNLLISKYKGKVFLICTTCRTKLARVDVKKASVPLHADMFHALGTSIPYWRSGTEPRDMVCKRCRQRPFRSTNEFMVEIEGHILRIDLNDNRPQSELLTVVTQGQDGRLIQKSIEAMWEGKYEAANNEIKSLERRIKELQKEKKQMVSDGRVKINGSTKDGRARINRTRELNRRWAERQAARQQKEGSVE